MVNKIHFLQSLSDHLRVPYIPDDQVNSLVEIRGTLSFFSVHLWAEIVEHTHLVAVRYEFISKMRPDKSCTSRNKDRFFHGFLLCPQKRGENSGDLYIKHL